MKCSFRLFLCMLLCPLLICGQEHSYTRYDSKDGLASSTVYCMTQDKEGFLWFGTETGLSRFDGTHFKNFTREDGLPDNDVTQLFADSKGRVWLSPFRKTICYYYKGKIHNSDNDPLLKKVSIHDNVYRFAEDTAGNILLQEMHRLHIIGKNGDVTTILRDTGKEPDMISLITGRKAGGFWFTQGNKIYILNNNRIELWKTLDSPPFHINSTAFKEERMMWLKYPSNLCAMSMTENKVRCYPYLFLSKHVNAAVIDDQHIACGTLDGAMVYNLNYPDSIQQYLPGITVSNVFKDSENNWWFCTFGKGVYRLNAASVLDVQLDTKKRQDFEVSSFVRYKQWIMAATKKMVIHKLLAQTGKPEGQVSCKISCGTNPLLTVSTIGDSSLIQWSCGSLVKFSADLSSYSFALGDITVKALCTHKNTFLLGTGKNLLAVDQATLQIIDTLWHERVTCLFSNNDTIFIGTLKGLYQLNPDKKNQFLGEKIKALQSRIAAVSEDANHVIWVATAGEGLIAWKNGKVIKHITRHNGLTSNICRTLFLANGKLWVGTDKGINKVNVLLPGFPIEKYTTSDGLSSDIINAIYVHDKKVFVGTPEGITIFDEEKMISQSRCDLRFINIIVGGEAFHPADAPLHVPHAKNSIQFDYVGISYKSSGDIRYRYRLLGLDSNWTETRETVLSFPALPSGEYALQMQAINKFDVHSKVVTIGFVIEQLLHEKNWFRILIGLAFLGITGLLVLIIIRRVRNREQEKTNFIKRISELEQLSRKAQMNPHFIFNSLNSIQQYVMDADVAGANKFISGFSRLIRQTLDFSSKPEISLEEELGYLTNYLDLEKTRLEDSFSWSVAIEEGVYPAEYYIPPMILQPFVENSVRHGLRFLKDKRGLVTITVKRANNNLICIVEDNGVGRKAAMQYKSINPINYQSKGLSLTADRITMFNKEHEQKIAMHIDDLEDGDNNSLGTRVSISFPII